MITSCQEEKSGLVKLRINNTTEYLLDSVTIQFPEEKQRFDSVPPKTSSAYHEFSAIYQYASISFKVSNKHFSLTPIDYAGEEKYDEGKFTYQISISNFEDRMIDLQFKRD